MTTSEVTGVLAVFLVLAFIALYWVIRHYKSAMVRSYQYNELGIGDPVGSELKSLALKLAAIQDSADYNDGMKPEHLSQSIRIKKEIIRLGREIKNNERRERVNLSSSVQKT